MVTDLQIAEFNVGVLTLAKLPNRGNNVISLTAQAFAEGGWQKNAATYNAEDTTLPEPGSHAINSVGVQSYLTEGAGELATARTILNGYYPREVAAFAVSADPYDLADIVGSEPWGTSGALMAESIPRAVSAVAALFPPAKPPVLQKIIPPVDLIVPHPGGGQALAHIAIRAWEGIPDLVQLSILKNQGIKTGTVPAAWWETAEQRPYRNR